MTRAAVLACSLAAAALLSFRPIYEPDLWWHLAQGRENAAGHLVRTNLFSFTYPDYRQPYNSWLFDLACYLAWQALGATGIQVLQAVFITLTLVTLFAACRIRAPAWSAAAILAIGLFVLEPRAIPRPHLFSFAAFAACTLLIETAAARRSAAPLWWAVALVGLWSNAHVECVFGVVLLFAFAASEWVWPRRLPRAEAGRALTIAMAAAAATLLNPYGWGLWQYLYENLSVQGVVAIAELLPPSWPGYRAFYAYVALTAVLLIADRRGFALSDAVVFGVFAAFGLMHLRETPLVLCVTAPLAAQRLAGLTARGLDYRAILVDVGLRGPGPVANPAASAVARIRDRRRRGRAAPVLFEQRHRLRTPDRVERSGVQQRQPGRIHRLDDVPRRANLPGHALSSLPAGPLPHDHRRVRGHRTNGIGSSRAWTGRWSRCRGRTSSRAPDGFPSRSGEASIRTTRLRLW